MERIFVTYRPVGGIGPLAYHMTLNYIDKQGQHHVIDGGPEVNLKGVDAITGAFDERFNSKPEENTDSEFGRLMSTDQSSAVFKSHKKDIYDGGRIQKPYTSITEGQDLRAVWDKFSATANELSGRFEYRSTKQNSNTFIGAVLRRNGFHKKLGIKDHGLSEDMFIDDVNMPNHDPDRTIKLRIPGAENKPNNPLSRLEGKVQLAPPRKKLPLPTLPKKGPERVKVDASYNPFDIDGNGDSDLLAEAHMMRDEPWLAKKLIRAAGREDFFKHFFEAA